MANFNEGDRVFWTDPDEGIASGIGTITFIGRLVELKIPGVKPSAFEEDEERILPDTIISLKMDDGGEVECFAHELKRLLHQGSLLNPIHESDEVTFMGDTYIVMESPDDEDENPNATAEDVFVIRHIEDRSWASIRVYRDSLS